MARRRSLPRFSRATAASCISSSKTSSRSRPSSLARYIAASALRSSTSASGPSPMARPRLAVRNTSVPSSSTNGWASAWSRRSAIANTALLPATCSERITNSSPPKRAMVSSGRTIERSRSAKRTSSWSPAPWPRLSLTTLNRSRSRKRTATSSLSCRARHQRVLEPVEHEGAVGQAGEVVVDGLVGEPALGLVALERDLEQLPGGGDRGPLVGVGLARFGVVHRDGAELPAAIGHVEHRRATTWTAARPPRGRRASAPPADRCWCRAR